LELKTGEYNMKYIIHDVILIILIIIITAIGNNLIYAAQTKRCSPEITQLERTRQIKQIVVKLDEAIKRAKLDQKKREIELKLR